MRKGYAFLHRTWEPGDCVELALPVPVERIYAHPSVRENVGRVNLPRGTVVGCIEEADNGKGLNALELPSDAALAVKPGQIGDVRTPFIHAGAKCLSTKDGAGLSTSRPKARRTKVTAEAGLTDPYTE